MSARTVAFGTGALLAAAVLGGAALGLAAVGSLDGETTTVVREVAPLEAQPARSSSDEPLSTSEIYRGCAPGVVQITSTSAPTAQVDPFFGSRTEQPGRQALGSGFVIDKAGHISPNYHVVEGGAEIEVSFTSPEDIRRRGRRHRPLDRPGRPARRRPLARALTPLPLADSDDVTVGDPVVAIGNPFRLDRTATAGIVSALQRAVTAPDGRPIDHVIQTDAPINQGNSGGRC